MTLPAFPGAPPFRDELAQLFAASDAHLVDVPILQPADPYLDTAGEALRRRIFLTRSETGRSLCLRPDFTIPVAISHIERGESLPRRYAYSGLVFRQDRAGSAEFHQAGIEDLGAADTAEADARAIADAVRALETCGLDRGAVEVTVGDQGVFEAFLQALSLPEGWRRRLVRAFGQDDLLAQALDALGRGGSAPASLEPDLVRLARARDVAGLAAEIADLMEEGGLPPHRGRTAEEVAARLIEKVAATESRLEAPLLEQLRSFLAVDVPLAQADKALGGFGVDLGRSLALFARRTQALAAHGIDPARIRYRAAFGRPLDYYTGLVFEIAGPDGAVLVGGGRYDRLVSFLGAREPIPAVGFSLWLDRIGTAIGARP